MLLISTNRIYAMANVSCMKPGTLPILQVAETAIVHVTAVCIEMGKIFAYRMGCT